MHKFTVQIVLIAVLVLCVTHSKAVGSPIAYSDPAMASSQARIVGWISDNLIGPIYDMSREKLACVTQCMQRNPDYKPTLKRASIAENYALFYQCLNFCT